MLHKYFQYSNFHSFQHGSICSIFFNVLKRFQQSTISISCFNSTVVHAPSQLDICSACLQGDSACEMLSVYNPLHCHILHNVHNLFKFIVSSLKPFLYMPMPISADPCLQGDSACDILSVYNKESSLHGPTFQL